MSEIYHQIAVYKKNIVTGVYIEHYYKTNCSIKDGMITSGSIIWKFEPAIYFSVRLFV